jgi:hypothetical protein
LQFVDDLDQPLARLDQAGGLEDAADGRGDHGLLGLGDVAEHVAQEMDGTACHGQPSTLAIVCLRPSWAGVAAVS